MKEIKVIIKVNYIDEFSISTTDDISVAEIAKAILTSITDQQKEVEK